MHGHITRECYQLKRQIETLIQVVDLKEFILWIVENSNGLKNQRWPTQDQTSRKTIDITLDEGGTIATTPLNVVKIIYVGLHTGDSNSERKKNTLNETRRESQFVT